jgi:hypothetical protein
VLVYEELTNDSEPIKYYGYRDKFMSVNEQTKIPNYALMIYDVSESMFADLLKKRKQGFRIVPIEQHVKFEKCKKTVKEKKTTKLQASPQPELIAPVVDEKKNKSVSALKKFNSMFKSRINAKRSILGPVVNAPAEQAEQTVIEIEKRPNKPKKRKKRAGKAKEDHEIDYNDAKSDDEGILSGAADSDESNEKNDESRSESISVE